MHGMTAYFVRRILLVPLTFLCITFLVYTVLRLVPGGPVEEAKRQLKARAAGEAGGGGGGRGFEAVELTEAQVREIERYYKIDKPIPVGYAIWLGVYPDEEVGFSGILQGDFGRSTKYAEPVLDVIVSKFRISLFFGLAGFFSTWLVCVPLGVYKAIRHRGIFDTGSSVLVFLGYSIPGFVACLVLLVLFGGGTYFNLVPLGGYRPDPEDWDALSFGGKVLAQIHHMLVPVFGYLLGHFATMTVLTKNSLLENLGADYVRTAFAKGLPERRVIFVHALRNSLIPVTATIGHAFALIFAGSFLIEQVCNIQGMGLLGLTSLRARDYAVVMGTMVFGELFFLFGNILSDLIWAAIDPRIRFGA
ncbi:MAG: ABC transporter permease [Planctomycetes bacterium]|nr:ABC transporter permease [Planctomycetota bacterium]